MHQCFGDRRQHDAVEFFEKFFDAARAVEMEAGRYSFWGGVQIGAPQVTHADRVFRFIVETRRRCKGCQNVRAWYAAESVLQLQAQEVNGGALTISEMYLARCASEEQEFECGVCEKDTVHESQSRVLSAPNVLVLRIKRGRGPRVPVAVEEHLDMPGMLPMYLIGVVYHRGLSIDFGHYTSLCRGPGGRFWY